MLRFNDKTLNCAVEKTYNENDNYFIQNFDESKDVVYIYFSSNGLFFPDKAQTFKNVILQRNY